MTSNQILNMLPKIDDTQRKRKDKKNNKTGTQRFFSELENSNLHSEIRFFKG